MNQGWKSRLRQSGAFACCVAALGLAAPAMAEDVIYTVVDGVGIPEPLSQMQANPDRGGVIYLDPKRGDCRACHQTASLPARSAEDAPIGPDLDGVAGRYSAAELRLLVANPRIRRPDSAMPAYFNVSAEIAASHPEAPQPVLTAREVEDVVAFLQTLTDE
ncbi:c-type cytochrome [bacterium]|nr:c-type cytochrome [bacterium]